MRIEIAGSIATGKSTLAELLRPRGWNIVSEDLTENPYISRSYNNPVSHALDKQLAFVIAKASALETSPPSLKLASDFAMACEYAYAEMHLGHHSREAVHLCHGLINMRTKLLGEPDTLVYLTSSPEDQLRRIQARGRGFEQGLDIAYLERLNDLINQAVALKFDVCRVVSIDTRALDIRSPAFLDRLERSLTLTGADVARNLHPAP